jgi:hypothetical protein
MRKDEQRGKSRRMNQIEAIENDVAREVSRDILRRHAER